MLRDLNLNFVCFILETPQLVPAGFRFSPPATFYWFNTYKAAWIK